MKKLLAIGLTLRNRINPEQYICASEVLAMRDILDGIEICEALQECDMVDISPYANKQYIASNANTSKLMEGYDGLLINSQISLAEMHSKGTLLPHVKQAFDIFKACYAQNKPAYMLISDPRERYMRIFYELKAMKYDKAIIAIHDSELLPETFPIGIATNKAPFMQQAGKYVASSFTFDREATNAYCDFIYAGFQTSNYRLQMLAKYMPDNASKICVGCTLPGWRSISGRTTPAEANRLMRQANGSLVLYEEEHIRTGQLYTMRFWQSLCLGQHCFVPLECDPSRKLFGTWGKLQEALYVSDAADIEAKLYAFKHDKAYRDYILDLQKAYFVGSQFSFNV